MMNCSQAENWLLLRASGELAPRRGRRLDRHLAACAACRAFGQDLPRVNAAARAALPAGEPGAPVMAAIRQAARAARSADRPAASRTRAWWRPALAAAAALLLVAGEWHWLIGRRVGGVSPVARVTSTPAANGEWVLFFLEEEQQAQALSNPELRQELTTVDCDLLLLEGLAI